MKKILLVICDGLGDLPVQALGNKTPLEAADTPNLNALCAQSVCGTMNSIKPPEIPESDNAHLSIFGYELEKYYCGRGPFESAGVGLKLREGDVALRANFGTVDETLTVIDRRAGRIENIAPLCKAIDGMKINGVTFIVKPGTAYRAALVMRGSGLSASISNADPHEVGQKILEVKALGESEEAKKTALLLNEFLKKSHEILQEHALNKKRKAAGLPLANHILCRGAGFVCKIPSFKERFGLSAACISGAGLYKGVASMVGMKILKVKGTTGLPNTNVKAKFAAAKKALKKFDFVFVHIKAADSLGEDGNCSGKKEFIEKIDAAAKELRGLKNTLVVVTADHSTPCEQKKHSADPVPLMIAGTGSNDGLQKFCESECKKGSLGQMLGNELMPKLAGLAKQ